MDDEQRSNVVYTTARLKREENKGDIILVSIREMLDFRDRMPRNERAKSWFVEFVLTDDVGIEVDIDESLLVELETGSSTREEIEFILLNVVFEDIAEGMVTTETKQ